MTNQTIIAERFVLSRPGGSPGAVLALNPHGQPALALYDDRGEVRLVASIQKDGTPALLFYDAKGVARLSLAVMEQGAAVTLASDGGDVRATLAVLPNGSGNLRLNDEHDSVSFDAP